MNSWLEKQRKEDIKPLAKLLWFGCIYKNGAVYDRYGNYLGFHKACKKYGIDLSIYDVPMTMVLK